MSDKLFMTSVVFGKPEEMDKCFYSLKHHIDIPVQKLIFINTSDDFNGQDNVEVFNSYREQGDRCFVCDGNYYSTPYRYMDRHLIPRDTKHSLSTECDIWLDKKTDYFSQGLQLMKKKKNVGMIAMMTRYLSPELYQKTPEFEGFKRLEVDKADWTDKGTVPWHFVILKHKILQRYFKGKGREHNDVLFQRYCENQSHHQIHIFDGREFSYHMDDKAMQKKDNQYSKYYQVSEFKSRHRSFDSSCFTEV